MAKYDNFSREELIELLQKQDKELARKKYGLVWDSEKEPEQVVLDCAKKLPILKNIAEKDIKTNDGDYNIMIEGDNYHALQVLNYTHKGKIDVIYIDPPYNTGNKDFIYNDKYVDKEDGYRHSKWLNFMEKRLELAKELLKDKGVMFISIDEHEFANLKLLCDKIFNEHNVECIIWRKNGKQGNTKKIQRIKFTHEYIIIVYKNDKNNVNFGKVKLLPNWKGKKTNPDNDPRGNWESGVICRDEEHSDQNSQNYYSIKLPSGRILTREFYFDYPSFLEYEKENKIYYPKNGDGIPRLKIFEKEEQPYYFDSIIDEMGTFTDAKDEIKEIFNSDIFDTPKPRKMIKEIFRAASHKKSLILDFFAGSGTTGHAILDLNKQDGGKRKFILCTNNDGNIATQVCYPRVKKVIYGYQKNDNEEFIEGLGGNLKYFKTDFVVNSKNKTQTKINLAKQCSEMLCLKTGIFNLLDEENPCFKIFDNNSHNQFLCVYFDLFGENIQQFINKIKTLNGEKFVFMFSLDENVDKSLFEKIEDIKIEPIPQKILGVYKKIAKEHIKGDNYD